MRFDAVRPALLQLVTSCIGVRALWDDGRRPFIPPAEDGFASSAAGVFAFCKLNITSAIGTDARVMAYDSDADPALCLHDTIIGTRRATFSVQVISFDPSDGVHALGYLETLRTRLASEHARASLEAVNCALWETGAVVPLAPAVDEHVSSIASLDVFLGLVVTESDSVFAGTPANPGAEAPIFYGPIDEVDATDEIIDADPEPMVIEGP